jgi:NhaA family Na+:H+ antiporter
MFFFVVGLELKREFIGGELRDLRKVTLPVAAAIMGMVFPALIYLVFNGGTPVAHGWGIPMATDIAFALAVVYLLGDRVPVSAKVFLTTLAIVDDLGSVLVIALFYTSQLSVGNLLVGLAFLAVMFVGNKMGVKSIWFYGILGIGGVWTAFLLSGIHATIAAVLSAMVIPADSQISEDSFVARMRKLTRRFDQAETNDVRTLEPDQVEIIARVKTDANQALPPLQRLEHSLHPFVSFFVMPVFALGNAGVSFVDMDLAQLFDNHIAVGVMLGLLAGKPLGILSSVWLMERLGLGRRSKQLTWRRLTGLGFLASIGFTMSMFVTTLAFNSTEAYSQAKVGIFAASILGGIIGYRILSRR